MADNGVNNMGDVSQQASDQVTGKIKEKAEKGAKKVANKVGKKVGKAVKKGAKKVTKAAAKAVKAAVKAAVKTAVTAIKTLISLIVKLLVVAWPFVLILLVIVLVLVVIADVIYGERGSGQVNDFNPAVMNPMVSARFFSMNPSRRSSISPVLTQMSMPILTGPPGIGSKRRMEASGLTGLIGAIIRSNPSRCRLTNLRAHWDNLFRITLALCRPVMMTAQ